MAVWAVTKTLSKNLIADPPCKVLNGKGFEGTCPLAPPCARSYEIGIPSLLRNCVLSCSLLLYQRDESLIFILVAEEERRKRDSLLVAEETDI